MHKCINISTHIHSCRGLVRDLTLKEGETLSLQIKLPSHKPKSTVTVTPPPLDSAAPASTLHAEGPFECA